MRTKTINLTIDHDDLQYECEVEVEYEVGAAEPDVGIMGEYIDGWTAKVVGVDPEAEGVPDDPELLAELQKTLDRDIEEYTERIEGGLDEEIADGAWDEPDFDDFDEGEPDYDYDPA